jgi:hypothetical protein
MSAKLESEYEKRERKDFCKNDTNKWGGRGSGNLVNKLMLK